MANATIPTSGFAVGSDGRFAAIGSGGPGYPTPETAVPESLSSRLEYLRSMASKTNSELGLSLARIRGEDVVPVKGRAMPERQIGPATVLSLVSDLEDVLGSAASKTGELGAILGTHA